MNKGYALESEIEDYFLELEGKKKQDPIFDGQKVVRTFRVPASGMMASLPGDVITANPNFPKQFMIECKARTEFTKKKGQVFRLDYNWVTKNEQESAIAKFLPLLIFSFKRTKKNRIWVICNKNLLQELNSSRKPNRSLCISKKKRVLFIKDVLDKEYPTIYTLENTENVVVPFSMFWEDIRKWKK